MRRLFTAIILSLVLFFPVLALSGNNIPQLNVGDPMPCLDDIRMQYEERVFTAGYILRAYMRGYEPVVYAAFEICDGQRSFEPFGLLYFYDDDNAVLYLDNHPKDGIIDRVDMNPRRKISSDLPGCR